jgi:hypothetical protein
MSININTDCRPLIAVTAKYAPATNRKPRRVRMKLPRTFSSNENGRKRIIAEDQEVNDALEVAANYIFAFAGLKPVFTCQSTAGGNHDTLLYRWYQEGNENTEENNFQILGDSVFSLGRVKQHPRVLGIVAREEDPTEEMSPAEFADQNEEESELRSAEEPSDAQLREYADRRTREVGGGICGE